VRLDQTRIVIRERGYLEILDLALHVIRSQALPLLLTLAAGILPLALFNHWLLSGFLEDNLEVGFPFRYLFFMLILAVWEAPLATAPTTLYLGHAMFTEQPQTGRIFGELLQSLPQLILYQVVLRPLYFFRRPFLNEVILLERNPIRATDGSGRATLQRSRTLHRGDMDPLSRWFGTVTIGGLLLVSIWASLAFLRAVLLNAWEMDLSLYTVWFPLTIWIVIGFFAVVRFLCYLDLRIRREGWEVELAMRAEEARLTRAWK
jgi:hypothetical protein